MFSSVYMCRFVMAMASRERAEEEVGSTWDKHAWDMWPIMFAPEIPSLVKIHVNT